MELEVGMARVDITPPIGSRMQGYARRDHGAEGIHDGIFSQAFALDDGSTTLAIVCCDLVGLSHKSTERARKMAEEMCNIDPGAVMICCSHTHGGPAIGGRSYVEAESEYLHLLERQIATSVSLAMENLANSELLLGQSSAHIGVNRRLARNGKMVIGRNPEGTIDPEVQVLRIDNLEGKIRGLIFNYACHPATLVADNYLITSDYVGYARGVIRGALDLESNGCGFVNGAGGDINPYPRGNYELAQKHGMELGSQVIRGSFRAHPLEAGCISWKRKMISLPLSPPPPFEEMEREFQNLEEELNDLKREGGRNTRMEARVLWLREMLERTDSGSIRRTLPVEIQAFRIGNLGIIALPAEVFVEIGLSIKRKSPFQNNIIAGYSNGNIGYIPTAKAFQEGGYEPESYVYRLEQGFQPQVGEITEEESLKLLDHCLK